MRLAHILVCHTTDPTKAIESIPHRPGAIWYVFLHSESTAIEAAVTSLMASRGGNVFPYRTNRGLARSWNDGLHLAMEAGCQAALLLNDDLVFREKGYAEFADTIAAVRAISTDVAYVTPLGLETGASLLAGQVIAQQFACCAISPEAVERVGYFDENFFPAYYEDVDYDRRCRLLGMSIHVHQQVLVEHERSATHRSMSDEDKTFIDARFQANKRYFERKWGTGSDLPAAFGQADLGCHIAFEKRHAPYGAELDPMRS